MSNLVLNLDCLYVFIDETGHEHLAGSTFYGLGGCAVMGRDYEQLIAGPWAVVRLLVTGNENSPLHAAPFGRNSTPEQKEEVARFFREKPFMRFGAAGAATTILPDGLPLMHVVIESLKQRIVDVAKWTPFKSIGFIFEHNQRANRLIQQYFGDVRFQVDGTEVPTDCYFMPKSSNDPALEVADFVVNAIGSHARRTLVEKKTGFGKDFQAVFQGIDRRLVSFMGIERVEVSAPASPSPEVRLSRERA